VGQKALDIAGEYEEISTGSISIKALASAKQWLQFSEVMKQHSEYVFEQTNLKRLTEQVNNWKSLMDRYMVEPLPKDQQWLVFDTCALMDFPDILDKLDKLKNIKLALPLKVLDELDNHKHDNRDEYQDRAITAQKIIKKIESLSGSITKIKHIPELLPHEHAKDPSADDMIISAARSLALSPVILVSSDVNFRNKANALELQVIATNDFIKKFFSIASSPAKPVQKQNHSKKGKKK
jgi:rRNA-processing protein FCF1